MKNFLFAGSLCLLFAACGTGNSSDNVQAAIAQMTPAQKLALLDHLDTTSMECHAMNGYLESIAKRFQEPEDTIADYTSRVEDVLKNKGIATSCLEILRDMNGFKRENNIDYQGAIVMYGMIRGK
jgi:hypothetical protein